MEVGGKLEMSNYMIAVDSNGQPYLAHHGIKGQKWGVRRFQNPDGTLTDVGKKRYLNDDGTLNARGIKRQAKQEYRNKIRQINKEHVANAEKFDKKKTDIWFDLDRKGGIKGRVKDHLKNEYNREQATANVNQKAIDARREYRTKLGKKKVDTWGMKLMQQSINETKQQTQSEFTKNYVKQLASDVVSSVVQYNRYRTSSGY